MKITVTRTTLAAAGAAGVLALGLALPASAALAEDPSPTPGTTASPDAAGPDAARPDAATRNKELAAALAKELGVDESKVAAALDKVQAAQQEARKAERIAQLRTQLDASVAEGKLTRAEADAILKAAENGALPGGGGRGGHGGRGE